MSKNDSLFVVGESFLLVYYVRLFVILVFYCWYGRCNIWSKIIIGGLIMKWNMKIVLVMMVFLVMVMGLIFVFVYGGYGMW